MGKVMPTCPTCKSFLNSQGVCLNCNPKTKVKPYVRPEYTKPAIKKKSGK